MPRKRIPNFNYSDVTINGHKYFKSYVMNADHKLIIVYGKTLDELCQKYGLDVMLSSAMKDNPAEVNT